MKMMVGLMQRQGLKTSAYSNGTELLNNNYREIQGLLEAVNRRTAATAPWASNTWYSQLREQVNNIRMVVTPLWRGSGNTIGLIGYWPNANCARRFRCEDNNVDLKRVRQVEPCHR